MYYRIKAASRKTVVNAIYELTGEKPVYTGVPECAYFYRGISLNMDNTVTAESYADTSLLDRLLERDLLERVLERQGAPVSDEQAWPGEFIGEADEPQEANVSDPVQRLEEDAEPEQESEARQEQPAEPDQDAESEQATSETSDTVLPAIAFPMSQHRAASLRNLVNTLFSRGKLVSKATGGNFYASQELVDRLQSGNLVRMEDVIKAIADAGAEGLRGITFTTEQVIFDGFPATNDPDVIRAWTALAAAINKTAIRQNNIRAKTVDDSNEKFSLRTWMTRMGMNGPELKAERSILYRNLSGHTAFHTQADQDKWTARQSARREELKQLKEADAATPAEPESEQ